MEFLTARTMKSIMKTMIQGEQMTTVNTMMSLSKETLSILKNFSTLNSNILIKPGNVITTVTPAKNIMAQATVSEDFEQEIGIFDLSKFLGTISLFNDPDFMFEERCVVIQNDNGSSVKYYYTEPSLLTFTDKSINMPEVVVSFDITNGNLSELIRGASVLQLPDVSIEPSDNGSIELVAFERPNKDFSGSAYSAGSNTYTVKIEGSHTDSSFEYHFSIDNLRLYPGDYRVSLCENVISRFDNLNTDLKYWIAFETTSRYNG